MLESTSRGAIGPVSHVRHLQGFCQALGSSLEVPHRNAERRRGLEKRVWCSGCSSAVEEPPGIPIERRPGCPNCGSTARGWKMKVMARVPAAVVPAGPYGIK